MSSVTAHSALLVSVRPNTHPVSQAPLETALWTKPREDGFIHADTLKEPPRCSELPVGTFGTFPNSRNPRVVWIACEPVPPLEILQERVERAMAGVGYPVEGKPFRPHLTLGRSRKDATRRDWVDFDRALEALEYHDVARVGSVDIMESTLRPGGPEYRIRTAVSLEA